MAGRIIVKAYIIITLCGTGGSAQYENCTDGYIAAIGDGYCYEYNNNEGCLYDGGDCCQCTSIDGESFSSDIGYPSFTCVDPSSPCYSPTAVALQSNCTDGVIANIRDGWCDEYNNNEGCLYDGGDCCQCTNIDDGSSSSSTGSPSFTCVDPSSPCYSPTAVALQSSCTDGIIDYIGTGYCSEINNNVGCQYDGGDCCQCTNTDDGSSSSDIGYPSFTCVDPSSPCYSPTAVALQSNCTGGYITIGDGICNDHNNNEGCLYDGGDCCQCTGIDDRSFSSVTGSPSFTCVDPSSPCYSPTAVALQSSCTDGYITSIGNGYCNDDNNNEGCMYDGGDCCLCTCTSSQYSCGTSGFSCLDPAAAYLEPYICETRHNVTSCQAGIQQEWIVENATQVRKLAEAVRCSGGSFNVTWKGKIIVNKTISVFDGTVINVTATNEHSVIDGDGKTRLFSVMNASLHLINITMSNGNAIFGGAIAASHSRLNFTGVSFMGNIATNDGGAIHLSNGTSMSFIGESSFSNNSASNGGAICVTGGSNDVLWTGNTSFSFNVAKSKGGALYMASSSSAHWTAEAHFLNNSAGDDGGALYLSSGSGAHWTADAHILNNSAGYDGGALYLSSSSSADWAAEALFHYNSAGSIGGALYLSSSSAQWTAGAHFLSNSAGKDGGALYLSWSSSAQWTAESHFLGNSAGEDGGALFLTWSSSAQWIAEAHVLGNSARDVGGALYLYNSSAQWTADAHFLNNSAGLSGGGLFVYKSSAQWTAEVHFLNNSAESFGGALWLYSSSTHWTVEAHFQNNSAGLYGGALYLSSSSANWTAEAHFLSNIGYNGGALYITHGSNASWERANNYPRNVSTGGVSDMIEFSGNKALSNGGAVYAGDSSYLSWSANVIFINNKAKNGGALFFSNSASTQWSGETNFTSNYATLNGGAIGIVSANDDISSITINDATSFVNNTCGGSGGAMSLVQSSTIIFNSKNIIFLRNSAEFSGGAVYTVFNGIGITFIEVTFVENVAQIGGAVHSTGSGTEVTVDKDSKSTNNPMTFDRCKFVGNYAFATGGAIDSASGQDVFINTTFEGNKARVGGALRLAGIASIDKCSFEENVSELGGGPAVSNNGYMSNVAYSYFYHNLFKCGAQEFLHFNELDDPYETVCDGCPPKCFECSFGERQGSPTCMSLSEAGVEHATSKGGYTTIEGLVIHKGYCRATNTSTNILRCFNTKACRGGLTGASNYCSQGYEGPCERSNNCSVCSQNYVSSLRFTCRECFDRTTVVVTATVLLGLALGVVIAIVSYLVSAEVSDTRRGIIDYMMRRIPLQSLKIIIILWQILTQFTYAANVKFPSVYQTFLDSVNLFNFDLSWVLSAGCLLEVDFHDRLLWTTITPLVIMGLLGITYAIAMHRNDTSPETTIRHIQHKHVSMALLVIILVYSSVSSVVFQMFACDGLDDGKRYLRADYTIDCDSSKHRVLQIYSGFMVLLYPVGIPALYASLLFWNSTSSAGSLTLQETPLIRSIPSLWKPYKPHRFYYEVIECARRISLTGVIVFIYPNSAAQVAATFAIAVLFIFVSEGMAPYASSWDAWMSRMGQAIIFATMYLALLLKVNVSGENKASQKMFEVILVACHGCMVLAGIVQIVIMALSLRRVVRKREDPRPRVRRPPDLALAVQLCVIEEDDISKDEL